MSVPLHIFGLEFQVSRKLRKLILKPKQFFKDIPEARRKRQLAAASGVSAKPPEGTGKEAAYRVDDTSLYPFELYENVANSAVENNNSRPLAILWKFNPWKREFIADYLSSYRVAFARGKTAWRKQQERLDQLEDLTFFFWGMSEPPEAREYAARRGIPIYRVEDGFIRSADLGSRHTVAMSLAIDEGGIYFDANSSSDLQRLLSNYEFDASPRLLYQGGKLMALMRGLQLSKYSLGCLPVPHGFLGPRLKKRILVVGQVEGDASIQYGLAAGWTNRRLIELACAENPDAEIFYKPHPDILQGYRQNAAALGEIQRICTVISQPTSLGDLFREVDHVYTMTSLSGMEAMIHGLPVTVAGAPFYAGWGLTDDRFVLPQRQRKLSLAELFCGAYLLYPKYLAALDDPVRGCLAAMLRIAAERRGQITGMLRREDMLQQAVTIGASEYWAVLLEPKFFSKLIKRHGKNLLSILPVNSIIGRCDGSHYRRAIAYMLMGRLWNSPLREKLLSQLRIGLSRDDFAALISDLWDLTQDRTLLQHWAWVAENNGDIEEARRVLAYASFTAASNEARGALSAPEENSPEGTDNSSPEDGKEQWGVGDRASILALAQFELRQRNLPEAYRLFLRLLLAGQFTGEVMVGLAEVARLRFDFTSAAELLKSFNRSAPVWKAGRAYVLEAQAHSLVGDGVQALEAMACACYANPQNVEQLATIESTLNAVVGELPYSDALLAALEVGDANNPIAKAKALISANQPGLAERVLLLYTPKESELQKYSITLSLAYSYQQKYEQAKTLVENLLNKYPTVLMFREALRLSIMKDDDEWGRSLLSRAVRLDLDVGEIYHRKLHFMHGRIREAYLAYRGVKSSRLMALYLRERYVKSLEDVADGESVLVVATFGPGDELRHACLYEQMVQLRPSSRFTFTCEPRLHSLLQRSFPTLTFMPVARIRELNWLETYEKHCKLPGSDLFRHLDNVGWEAAEAADKVTLVLDALGDVIHDSGSISGKPYLTADDEKITTWKKRLSSYEGDLIVGLYWRSFVQSYVRNEHYLDIKTLSPLFQIEGVRFINLQHDDCLEETEYVEQNYPGKLITFSDIDRFNDFENVAALISCLDLVCAPSTTVSTLASGLGVKTLLAVNSTELEYRRRAGTCSDLWADSLIHVQGEVLGNKASLVRALVNAIVAERQHRLIQEVA